jgi:hypothetical protein
VKRNRKIAIAMWGCVLPALWLVFWVGHCLPTLDPEKGWYVVPFIITSLATLIGLAVGAMAVFDP